MTLPVIRAQGLPSAPAPQLPRPSAGVAGEVADFGATLMLAAVDVRAMEEADRKKDLAHQVRGAQIEAIERLGKLRADADVSRDTRGVAARFDDNANAIYSELSGRFTDDDARREFETAFQQSVVGHRVAIHRRSAQLRADDDRAQLETRANRWLAQYGASSDPAVRETIAAQAGADIQNGIESGLITQQQGADALRKFSVRAAQADILGMMRDDPAALVGALKAGQFDLGPAERQRLITQAENAERVQAGRAESEARDAGRAEALALMRDNPAAAADQLAEKGAFGLGETEREQLRTRALREVEAQDAKLRDKSIDELEATAEEHLYNDPARLIDLIDAGAFDLMKPDQRARIRVAAQSELEQRDRQAVRERDQRIKVYNSEIAADVGQAEKAAQAGLPIANKSALIKAAEGTPSAERLAAAIALEADMNDIRAVPHSERGSVLQRARDRASSVPNGARHVEDLERAVAALRKSEEEDIYRHRAEQGLGETPPLDLGNPKSLRVRLTLARTYAAEHQIPLRYFSQAEAAQVAEHLAAGSLDDKIGLLASMASALEGDVYGPLGEIGLKNPLYAHAGLLIAETGDAGAARTILAGQNAIEEKTALRVSAAIRSKALASIGFGEAVSVDFGSARSTLINAASAHFAGAAVTLGIDLDDVSDDELAEVYATSIQQATGARLLNGKQYGGIQDVNDLHVVLPPSMSANQAEDVLSRARAADFIKASTVSAVPTYLGGRKIDFDDPGTFALRWIGGGVYVLGLNRNDRFEALEDGKTGAPAMISLEALEASVGPRTVLRGGRGGPRS